jgi:hypothetical protein
MRPSHETPYGRCVMSWIDLSAVRYVDLDASLATYCSWCRHSEFVHSDRETGPCLFSECECPQFFPMIEGQTLTWRVLRAGCKDAKALDDSCRRVPGTPRPMPSS